MIKLTKENIEYGDEYDILKNVLLASLPSKIFAGYTKESSNINDKPTTYMLDNCPFIHFNSEERISFIVFDIDYYEGLEAKEYFQSNAQKLHSLKLKRFRYQIYGGFMVTREGLEPSTSGL